MTTIVLDASVVLKWILLDNEELVEEARKLHDQILSRELKAIAPESILTEVANVMFWKMKFGKKEIVNFLGRLTAGIVEIVPFYSFKVCDLLEIMDQYGLSIYDAYYVSLAIKNECKVVTLDKKILKIKNLAIGLHKFDL